MTHWRIKKKTNKVYWRRRRENEKEEDSLRGDWGRTLETVKKWQIEEKYD